MKVLILAGGFAKRLWPLTLDKAKPLLPLGHQTMMCHILEKLPQDASIIVSTNLAFEPHFKEWLALHPDRDITLYIEDSKNESGKKGALAAVKLVIDDFKIQDDLLVIGGDNYFEFSLEAYLNVAKDAPMLAAYDIQDTEQAKKYGVVVVDGTRVLNFQEKPENPKSTLVGTCVYYFPKSVLEMVREAADITPDKIGSVFEYFLSQGVEPQVFASKEYWNDVGSLEAYLHAHSQSGKGSDVPPELQEVGLGNTFEGVNYIHPSVIIENSTIKDSIIFSGSIIKNSQISSCVIDKNCELQSVQLAGGLISNKNN
ncbi:NDP-sugar synthase [Patescibacteria group bacterium]|nr:NDP-sugar synthase [Patescibacteria group bacterium]